VENWYISFVISMRAFLGQSPYPLATQGYAMVGVLYSASKGFVDWIGER
jgi:hypothetical protein